MNVTVWKRCDGVREHSDVSVRDQVSSDTGVRVCDFPLSCTVDLNTPGFRNPNYSQQVLPLGGLPQLHLVPKSCVLSTPV